MWLPNGVPATGYGLNEGSSGYLFPNGAASGEKLMPASPDIDWLGAGDAVPPIPELAWTRSSAYNSIYYDPLKVYTPWAPAYVDGAVKTFASANPAAARSHPVNGSSTLNLTVTFNAAPTTAQNRFAFTPGMTIPANAVDAACATGAPLPDPLPYTVPGGSWWCKAGVPYFPATFWHPETCAADGQNCVRIYDGRTLRRYEIKPAGVGRAQGDATAFPSGRGYDEEIQNFANWYTYYRKRRLMLAGAMGGVLENITGLRLGVLNYTSNFGASLIGQTGPVTPPTLYDAEDANPALNRLAISGRLYAAENRDDFGTPTHWSMVSAYHYFNNDPGLIQYACQRNAAFFITDGFSNDGAQPAPLYAQATYGQDQPYQPIAAYSLADKALGYFTGPLRRTSSPLAPGRVPLGDPNKVNPDLNPDLHLSTYALTLGARGTIWPTATDPFTDFPVWPTPVAGTASMIDDLWHATLNGRGLMFGADNAADTAAAIHAGLQDIVSQTGAQSSVAVTNPNLQRSDARAYYGLYNPAGWTGDLTANAIDKTTGAISATPAWSANARLTSRTAARVIASADGPFDAATVGAAVNPGNLWGSTADVIDYLRGDRAKEGATFRARRALMGAVINAQPVAADGVVYVASGEGMLHAVDSANGDELWAYVPRAVLPAIGKTTARAYTFKTLLDGGPVVGAVAGRKRLLVAGMGAAGRSYYALDVTSPRGLSESQLAAKALWEFPASDARVDPAKVGLTPGQPAIVRVKDVGHRVLVTSGYDSTFDYGGRLWLLDPATGVGDEIAVPLTGTPNDEVGLAHVSGFVEPDGSVQYAYGGDLLGNLWRFDLKNKSVRKMAILKDARGNAQPVTAPPELIAYKGKRIVLIGTGRLLDIGDFGGANAQSLYAIADADDSATALDVRASPLMKKLSDAESGNAITGARVDWTQERGWYVDLPAGEQANTKPRVEQGLLAFTTNVAGAADCSASSYLYTLNMIDGGKPPDSVIRTTLSTIANSTTVTLVQTSDGRIRVLTRTFEGVDSNTAGTAPPAIKPAKNAWREVRK
jgi:type IV pilus assembly protein PilY1